jgi:hypothetical protein
MSVLTEMDAEIQGLEVSLERDSRYVRLRELRRLREEYANMPAPIAIAPSIPVTSNDHPSAQVLPIGKLVAASLRTPGRKRSPERDRAIQEIKVLLNGRGVPMRTVVILEHLMKHGIDIGGTNKQNNLSALLHQTGEFQSHGRTGWTLSPN